MSENGDNKKISGGFLRHLELFILQKAFQTPYNFCYNRP